MTNTTYAHVLFTEICRLADEAIDYTNNVAGVIILGEDDQKPLARVVIALDDARVWMARYLKEEEEK